MINKKGQKKRQRATNLLNLGITNRKIDQQYRTSVSGRVGLNLIQTCTNDRNLNNEVLKNIGILLMYVIDHCIPRTPFDKEFKEVSSYEKEYLDLFADQLFITDIEEKKRFCIPAISFLINGDLHPHCDTMNPTSSKDDYTVCLSIQIEKDKLPSSIPQEVIKLYPYSVPFCLVIYKRKALCYYRNRMTRMHNYINNNDCRREGRRLLVHNIMSVDTSLDYVGNFFCKTKRETLKDQFTPEMDKVKYQSPKKAILPETIDKLGYYSGLLHTIYLYLYRFGVDRDECMSIVLFFAHQCNTTSTLVTVLLRMVTENNNSYTSNSSFYNLLAFKCSVQEKLKQDSTDVGRGIPPRHELAHNNVFSSSVVSIHLASMNLLFSKARSRMQLLKPNDMKRKLELYHWLQSSLCTLTPRMKGITYSQSSVIIQLSSLIGILPLDYYTQVPIQYDGDSGMFIKNLFSITHLGALCDKEQYDFIIDTTVKEMEHLQDIFTSEYTCNMNENLMSIISNDRPRFDIYYFLPWLLCDKFDISIPKLQLMFRINGDRKNIWRLEAFDGINTISFFTTNDSDAIITYNKSVDGLILKSGHKLNCNILRSLFKNGE